MDAAIALMDHHGSQFKHCMEPQLVPKFMVHVQSLTPGTTAKANELVSKMIEVYSDADVVAWCAKALINTAEVAIIGVGGYDITMIDGICCGCDRHPYAMAVWKFSPKSPRKAWHLRTRPRSPTCSGFSTTL
jgi:hypothetical protein